ncbi:MAG TPA: plastocyanin/azurin family copper-binding protein [Solirubrobacterales bacterium]|nr:plastocyanin/azurin family copper-binding protein [Solirubrobacterales bacterium]
MDNETLFYVFGIALAVSAVVISFVALKVKSFPGKAFPVVVLWFAILIGGATTFSVLLAKDHEAHDEAGFKHAGEEFEAEGHDEAAGEAEEAGEEHGAGAEEAAPDAAAKGPGGTLQIAADPTAIAYDKASLSSKPGKVTIDFDNPSTIPHDVAIEGGDGKEIAASELVTEAETSVTAELAAGTYTFFCTVPGHREAGMEGPLEVQ